MIDDTMLIFYELLIVIDSMPRYADAVHDAAASRFIAR